MGVDGRTEKVTTSILVWVSIREILNGESDYKYLSSRLSLGGSYVSSDLGLLVCEPVLTVCGLLVPPCVAFCFHLVFMNG